MEGLIVFLIILGAIAVLVINYFIAKEFYQVAQYKGYNEQKYLWIAFLLGIIGYLLVIALPDRGNSSENVKEALSKSPAKIANKAKFYKKSAKNKTIVRDTYWICGKCETKNPTGALSCKNCGAYK